LAWCGNRCARAVRRGGDGRLHSRISNTNLLRDLFAEGALSTAFVTTFSKTIAREGDAAAWRLANKVATLTFLVLGALCALGMVFSHQLVALIAPGFHAGRRK